MAEKDPVTVRKDAVLQEIAEFLGHRGHRVVIVETRPLTRHPSIRIERVNGVDPDIDITEDRKMTARFLHGNGVNLRVQVGALGKRRQFPQRKDGSFNFVKIAEGVEEYIKECRERARDRLSKQKSYDQFEVVARQLNEQYNLDMGRTQLYFKADHSGISLRGLTELDEQSARELAAALPASFLTR